MICYEIATEEFQKKLKALHAESPSKQSAPGQPTELSRAPKQSAPGQPTELSRSESMPSDQLRFISALQAGRSAFRAAPNDMAKGAARPARKQQICSAVRGLQATGWVGHIDTLSSNSDGKGVLSIKISDNAYVKTWNNALSDIADSTLVEPSTRFFARLITMKKGQFVRFSGSFIQSEVDCFKESSVTLGGSMQEPEFLMRFADVVAFQ
jgi:hypothetical protein